MLVPKRVTIETIFGCNSNCTMCVINHPTKRKKGIMPFDRFVGIIDALLPYRDKLEMMDLYGLGEPLLDPHIFKRIRYVKQKGFRNLGISTNADLMDEEKQRNLLESGIDTVLFSIDGIKKETHESIRKGVNFERVVENCSSIIRMRNAGDYHTRFVLRFIRHEKNRNEWEAYKKYWSSLISREKRDFITAYDVHSWGGDVSTKDTVLKGVCGNQMLEKMPCSDIFEILYILSDGSVPLCNEDWLHPKYNFGNAMEKDPVEIWNSEAFMKIRELHKSGEKNKMDICSECTVLYSILKKEIV